MPLSVLLILVAGGIGGIALVLHLLGLSRIPPLTEGRARAGWLREYPDAVPEHITVAASGHAALIQTAQGAGLVWAVGADTTARRLIAPRLTDTAQGLRVRLRDPAAPHITLRLTDTERQTWRAALTGEPT
ncbi:hypothetical protein [Pseudosulfitobacter pseudonitzschiae]|uniref:hypothetical protein n=1 Tax=Pseudosulfitobacter pseudonitzschiae TaxID=1402135 RepID=UPI001AFCA357|nr:hypothetical protein [Pseudosulfitobacter pseudonitzschiae]MBM1814944.1 hypothetical protein [Pseudosulfitobacter pseudonitzschiae]MBM1831935.1 hypothetical protein [Pseudosulfitobacter pseudonitzschiae]MBM1836803.1 hypothetical protein [Pseudosulfitobacter pseudonitzschiae]MBM1841649.1 hypothetical protein [Pseudosulfitobacter pseudonitzschiae]MBM1846517.1 hypothetical protein [Pseudosulfitobacter pseudonitzschiae]